VLEYQTKLASKKTYKPISKPAQTKVMLVPMVCSARERADSAHSPAPSCYRNRFPYDSVTFGDAQKNRFWSVYGAFSRWTEYS